MFSNFGVRDLFGFNPQSMINLSVSLESFTNGVEGVDGVALVDVEEDSSEELVMSAKAAALRYMSPEGLLLKYP